jgi:two-component system response regulator (stage 0 sporulation protein A)
MKDLEVIVSGQSRYIDKLCTALSEANIIPVRCNPNALDIQMVYLTRQIPILLIEDCFDYRELTGKLCSHDRPPHIYIIEDSQNTKYPLSEQYPNIYRISTGKVYSEVINTIKFCSLDMYKSVCVCEADLSSQIKGNVHSALCELGFTTNYIGTIYLKKILEAICLQKLKTTDSMCKTVYSYIADEFGVTRASVERSIRTAIQKCWFNSGSSSHVRYFGLVYSNKNSTPTNREFIMILGDQLLCELKITEAEMKKELIKSV